MVTVEMLKSWGDLSLIEGLSKSCLNKDIEWDRVGNFSEKADFLNRMLDLRKDPAESSKDGFIKFLSRGMKGDITRGWKDCNKNGIFFQEALESVSKRIPKDWNPADYLLECYLQAKRNGVPLGDMDLGRALRNLPSFMREYLIKDRLQKLYNIECRIPPPQENASSHVDIICDINGRRVYVWSFLNSRKSITRLRDYKLNGNRGSILDGFNLLLPFKNPNDCESVEGWYIPNKEYIGKTVLSMMSDYISYDDLLSGDVNFEDVILFFK